jgi:hypothetical protein
MPVISPTSIDDCIRFIREHRTEIQAGDYDVTIKPGRPSRLINEDLRLLAKHCESSQAVIAKETTAEEILEVLITARNHKVWELVAENKSTSARLLEALSNASPSRVARHHNTPAHVLQKLSKNSSDYVRSEVAKNSHTPVAVLDVLARDSYESVRRAVLDNPNCSAEILDTVVRIGFTQSSYNNYRKEVSGIVLHNPDALPGSLEVIIDWGFIEADNHPNASALVKTKAEEKKRERFAQEQKGAEEVRQGAAKWVWAGFPGDAAFWGAFTGAVGFVIGGIIALVKKSDFVSGGCLGFFLMGGAIVTILAIARQQKVEKEVEEYKERNRRR